jgi:hypothetical protein
MTRSASQNTDAVYFFSSMTPFELFGFRRIWVFRPHYILFYSRREVMNSCLIVCRFGFQKLFSFSEPLKLLNSHLELWILWSSSRRLGGQRAHSLCYPNSSRDNIVYSSDEQIKCSRYLKSWVVTCRFAIVGSSNCAVFTSILDVLLQPMISSYWTPVWLSLNFVHHFLKHCTLLTP